MPERYICAPPSATLYGLQLNATTAGCRCRRPTVIASKVLCSDPTRNEQVKTNV